MALVLVAPLAIDRGGWGHAVSGEWAWARRLIWQGAADGDGPCRLRQPVNLWKMNAAEIGHLTLDHARAIGSDDVAQFRDRELRAMVGEQPVDVQPSHAVTQVVPTFSM
jgi:hypothetical protein